jgi:hypothetical protein
MSTIIQLRRDSATNWTNNNPTLRAGEVGVDLTTGKIKVGDGSTAWTTLTYFTGDLSSLGSLAYLSAAPAGTLTGTTLSSTVVSSSLTSVGTLTNLTVTNTITGSVSGNAGTVTDGVYTTDTGTVTNTMLAGSISNAKLSNSSITVNGTSISLGGSQTVTAAAGTLTGTTLNSTVVNSSLTSVGTLTSLAVHGSSTLDNSNISTDGLGNITAVSFIGNGASLTGITNTQISGLGTMSTQNANSVDITGGSITGLSTPTGGSDAATKSYVDNATTNLSIRDSVTAATTADLGSITYNNGSSGVGATITQVVDSDNDGSSFITDTISLSLNQRVLVKNQTNAYENGLYTVTTVGLAPDSDNPEGIAWVLTRSSDYNSSSNIMNGTYTVVEQGAVYAGTFWINTTSGTITVGTTSLSFTELSVAPQTVTFIGDVTGTGAGTISLTLDTVNTNTGSFGSSTSIPSFDVNAKGLITAAGSHAVVAPAGTLTGTTLASNVLNSSLTSVGTLADLTVTNTITGSVSGNAGTVSTISGLITQGSNITITGSGTSGSPYNISSTASATTLSELTDVVDDSTNWVLLVSGAVPANVVDSSAQYSTGFGINALLALTTGPYNTGLGANALTVDTSGGFNTGVGALSLYRCTTGGNNAALGTFSMASLTTGTNNVAVGMQSGNGITTGSDNVFVGFSTDNGVDATLSTGSGNVVVGSSSYTSGDDSNEIIIGYNIVGQGSNTAAIGNSSVTDVYLGGGTAELHCYIDGGLA